MILYHGSNMLVEKPEINAGRRALDFGVGFYLTSNRDQAVRWAQVVALRRQQGFATLNCFDVDETRFRELKVLEFSGPGSDWLDFVVSNRKGMCESLLFDIVVGPVANDSTMQVIDDYMDGRYTKEEAMSRLLPQKLTDQYAFVSAKSLSILSFKGSEVV